MSGTPLGCGEDFSRALYDEHAAALTAYVQRLVRGDRQLAEDIVQETFVRAWKHAGRIPAWGVAAVAVRHRPALGDRHRPVPSVPAPLRWAPR